MVETRISSRVLTHTRLSETAFELCIERHDLSFHAGELLTLYGNENLDARDYTIASGERDEALDILYRLVPHGVLTPQLIQIQPGDTIECSGPSGTFVLRDTAVPIVFIATGTGIAPCRAFLRTHPDLNLTILHGARTVADLFYREELAVKSYYPCVSSEPVDGFQGRVSDRIEQLAFPPDAHFYLCGANEMIYEVTDWLLKAGFASEQIFNEPYYYRADD